MGLSCSSMTVVLKLLVVHLHIPARDETSCLLCSKACSVTLTEQGIKVVHVQTFLVVRHWTLGFGVYEAPVFGLSTLTILIILWYYFSTG